MVASSIPGRVRFKLLAVKRNAVAASEVRKTLSAIAGIAVVNINITTGSVLVNYNAKQVSESHIFALLLRGGYLNNESSQSIDPKPVLSQVVGTVGECVLSQVLVGFLAELAGIELGLFGLLL